MKIGVMVGPERGDTSRKVKRLLAEIGWAQAAGIPTAQIPQVPSDMEALQMVALLGARTAGVTDLSVRLLPIGNGRDELIASKNRTREVIAGLSAEFDQA
ncbi:MAG TPA: hypothetical protein VHZ03_12195 [Trebonia sp.]|jgi:hypothetical protein|nr:hypothetical protein [Trebonia sp.]